MSEITKSTCTVDPEAFERMLAEFKRQYDMVDESLSWAIGSDGSVGLLPRPPKPN